VTTVTGPQQLPPRTDQWHPGLAEPARTPTKKDAEPRKRDTEGGGRTGTDGKAGADDKRPLAGFIGPLTPEQEALRSGKPVSTNGKPPEQEASSGKPAGTSNTPPVRPLAGFIGPLPPELEVLRSGPNRTAPSLLPSSSGEKSPEPTHSRAGLAADDPRVPLIEQGYTIKNIDQKVDALQSTPLDLEGAKKEIAAADKKEQDFWKKFYGTLDRKEIQKLVPLAKAAEGKNGAVDPKAVQKFDQAVTELLSPKQLKELRELQRGKEDAQRNLEGQLLGQRLRDTMLSRTACVAGAKNITQDPYALARADARAFVAEGDRITAQRELEDAMTTLMTPKNQKALAPYRQEVLESAEALKANPQDTGAQERLKQAQANFDDKLTSLISASDHATLKGLIETANQKNGVHTLLSGEAATHQRAFDLTLAAEKRGGTLNETERKLVELAQGDYDLMRQSQNVRGLAVQAAEASDEEERQEKLGQVDAGITELAKTRADHEVDRAMFNANIIARRSNPPIGAPILAQPVPSTGTPFLLAAQNRPPSAQNVTTGPFVTPKPAPVTVGAEFAPYLPSPDLTVKDANAALDAARSERDELQKQLEAAEEAQKPKTGFWERVLDVGGGVLEAAAGVALMAAAGWTGVGAVAGAALLAHGAANTIHSATDWANDTHTSKPLSRVLQNVGLDEGAADRIDVGVSLAGTAVGGLGAASMIVRGTSLATKGAGVVSAGLTVDAAQAQGRYVFANDAANPFAVDSLTALGMSETAANYVLLAGGTVGVGGFAALGRRGPIVTSTDAAGSGATSTRPVNAGAAATDPVNNGAGATNPADTTKVSTNQPSSGLSSADSNGVPAQRVEATEPRQRARFPAASLVGVAEPPVDVAIIGANGNVGRTLLVDIKAAVNDGLSDLNPVGLMRQKATDQIAELSEPVLYQESLYGGEHPVNLMPKDFAYLGTEQGIRALQEAPIVVVTVPDAAGSRMGLFNQLRNYGVLQDPNKNIVLIRAGQGGQPVWSQMIRDDPEIMATFIGVEDSPYGTRVKDVEDGFRIVEGKRKKILEVSAASVEHPQQALDAMRSMFPRGGQLDPPQPSWPDFRLVPGSAMPWRAGFFIHPGVALWPENLARTMRGEQYFHYAEGVRSPEHGAFLQRLDEIKVELGRAYGANPQTFPEKLHTQFELPLIEGEPFHLTMARTMQRDGDPLSKKVYTSKSPKNLEALFNSRYIDEDLQSVRTMLWYAERAGLRFPELESYFQDSRQTLINVGMSQSTLDRMLFAYEPYLNRIPGGAPEIKHLLDHPHVRGG